MPIPTFDRMWRPLLELAAKQPITRQSAEEAMREHFKLTDEEMTLRIPSGRSGLVKNRAGWSMTYLTKAGLLAKVAPRTYRTTDAGLGFLQTHTGNIGLSDLLTFESFREFRVGHRTELDPAEQPGDNNITSHTPLEVIDEAVETIHADVRGRLLQSILDQGAVFFERLVLDVLAAMGYGDVSQNSIIHTGKSGDEGIDGRINQDALGLDQILVQAKRYDPDHVVPRKDIQAFVGSLAGQGVTKGVFITTSTFAGSAWEFVQRGSQTKVVLIDGRKLIDLMMRHKVGVRVERSIEVLDIDHNYFSEE